MKRLEDFGPFIKALLQGHDFIDIEQVLNDKVLAEIHQCNPSREDLERAYAKSRIEVICNQLGLSCVYKGLYMNPKKCTDPDWLAVALNREIDAEKGYGKTIEFLKKCAENNGIIGQLKWNKDGEVEITKSVDVIIEELKKKAKAV